jgi:hypothetical protein
VELVQLLGLPVDDVALLIEHVDDVDAVALGEHELEEQFAAEVAQMGGPGSAARFGTVPARCAWGARMVRLGPALPGSSATGRIQSRAAS